MHDGVDLGGPHDPVEDRVLLVGPHELGAFQGHPGFVGPEPQDHLHVGLVLEGLGHAPPQKVSSPVISTRRPIGQPNQTLRRSRSMSCRASCMRARMPSASSMTRLLE